MSTMPTEILETVAAAVDSTAPTEAGFDFEAVKALMDNLDPAALLPDLSTMFGWIELGCRVAVVIGPILLTVLGLSYLLLAPKEANYYFGYRTYFGMGSVQAWRFTQRLAGIVLGGLGLVLTGVMLVISGGFGALSAEERVWKALACLGIQAVLALAANLAIGITAMARFDRKGEYRKKK